MYQILDEINCPEDIQKLSLKELEMLASDLRYFLIEHLASTGGHLASNLGIVELTIALLKNFNFKRDKIIFDVGHQSYVYKILTGRKKEFDTLRKHHGLSGFPKRDESPYDFFDTGHSSNSISACLGMARARDLKKKDYEIISVIGDGALTGGMAFEALNDLGYHKTNMLIILNDNGMSISSNVGGMSTYLNHIRLTPSYNKLKKKVHHRLDRYHSNTFTKSIRKVKDSLKKLFLSSLFFEDLGLRYIGPIDGHNLKELNRAFEHVKEIEGPIVIHVVTKKGKGCSYAEKHPDKYHSVGPFEARTGRVLGTTSMNYSKAFENSMVTLAKEDRKIVAVTAAMKEGTGLDEFASLYPKRFFDVGIAEQHAVTFAAGLALEGLKPVFAVYSTFLQRAIDQIIEDVCMQNLPVVFAIDRAGLVGNDGETHQGIFDLSYLSMIPNLTILAPKTLEEMPKLLQYAFTLNSPVAIRYPKGDDRYPLLPCHKIKQGTWEILDQGHDVAFIATGRMVGYANEVIKELLKKGIDAMLINALFIKPLDDKILHQLGRDNIPIITIEDNILEGGLGSLITIMLANLGYHNRIKNIAIPNQFVEHGSVEELLSELGMDVKGLTKTSLQFLKSSIEQETK